MESSGVNSIPVLPDKPAVDHKDAAKILAPFEKENPLKQELNACMRDLADLEKKRDRTQTLLGLSREERFEKAPVMYDKHLYKLKDGYWLQFAKTGLGITGVMFGAALAQVNPFLFFGLAFGGCLAGFVIESLLTSNKRVDRSMLAELKATLLNAENKIPAAREKIKQLQEKIISGALEDPDAGQGGTIEDEQDFVLIDDLKIKKNKRDKAMSLLCFWKKRNQ